MVDAGAAGAIATGSGKAGTDAAGFFVFCADAACFFVFGTDTSGFFVGGTGVAGFGEDGTGVVGFGDGVAGATDVCLTAGLCTGLDLCGRLLGADLDPEWALAVSLIRVNIGGCFNGLKCISGIVMYPNTWSHRRPLLSPMVLPLLPLFVGGLGIFCRGLSLFTLGERHEGRVPCFVIVRYFECPLLPENENLGSGGAP